MENKQESIIEIKGKKYTIMYPSLEELRHPEDYENPRKWPQEVFTQLEKSIMEFGMPQPLIVNSNPNRKGVIIGGNFRYEVLKKLGYTEIPVIFVDIEDVRREKELNLRLNKNVGEFDEDLLAKYFTEEQLSDYGWSSEELDEIFEEEETPEEFDLQKELEKLQITEVTIQKGDVFQLGDHRLMCGDSTIEEDVLKLMNGEKAHACICDPPYILSYLTGKQRHGNATVGFGAKRDRRYLETDILPPDFTEKWMANVAKIQKPDFSIMVFEHPKNLRTIWNELEKHWTYRNTITWHLPNRVQGFSAKYKFFNKSDIALLGTGGDVVLNTDPESDELLQNEYENALFATSGKPHWESYEKGKKYCPTDFVEYVAADEKSSGQRIIFGTKPIEILLPYAKVLTKRDDIIIETFCGSGSMVITAEKLKRRCYAMEKVPTYCAVIINRWEKFSGKRAVKIDGY